MKKIFTTTLLLFAFSVAYPQHLLFDDIHAAHHTDSCWLEYIDGIEAHGVTVHLVSEEDWDILPEMDVLWFAHGNFLNFEPPWCPEYPDSVEKEVIITKIIDFARNGGRIVYWASGDPFDGANYGYPHGPCANKLLTDPRWETGMYCGDNLIGPGAYCTTAMAIAPLPPITDVYVQAAETSEVVTGRFGPGPIIECGEHCFPILGVENLSLPFFAISYPFAQAGNCQSYILLLDDGDNLSVCMDGPEEYDTLAARFALHMLYAACDVPGYELAPCAIPEYPDDYYNCFRAPNPFTPNCDGFNDYCQFEFDGMGESEGTISIFNLHGHEVRQIDVPEGANAKASAQWDGKDNNRNPLPQGVYLYVIENGGEIVCEGTVCIAR